MATTDCLVQPRRTWLSTPRVAVALHSRPLGQTSTKMRWRRAKLERQWAVRLIERLWLWCVFWCTLASCFPPAAAILSQSCSHKLWRRRDVQDDSLWSDGMLLGRPRRSGSPAAYFLASCFSAFWPGDRGARYLDCSCCWINSCLGLPDCRCSASNPFRLPPASLRRQAPKTRTTPRLGSRWDDSGPQRH